jgi:nucleoside-diphosphate-sugar epimerase
MRIFLTGATGYIGSAVGDALLAAGHEVTGLVRAPKRDILEKRGIRPFIGDLGNPGAVAAEAAKADATIHAAFEPTQDGPAADRASVDAVLNALTGRGQTFIYTSGLWVMGNTKKDADEDSPLDPPPVVAWRPPMEQKVVGAAGRGIRTVVIRPAMVYGRGGGVISGFLQSARETGAARFPGTGENHWSFVHVEDLADLYVRALQAEPGNIFIGASGPALRVREVAEAASRAAGAGGRVHAWSVEEASAVLGPWVQGLVLDQQVSGRKAERVLGWKPKAPQVLEDIQHFSYAAG